jgi:hypothetical protein
MRTRELKTELDARYSTPNAVTTPWETGRREMVDAKIYWLSTVRPDGRPHVTPLIAVWLDDSIYFCTGAAERKAMNLERNPNCVITTGCNLMDRGLDIVVEGRARNVADDEKLSRIAQEYKSKYGWDFTVSGGALHGVEGNVALVYEVMQETAFGFGKGEVFSQTRWRF